VGTLHPRRQVRHRQSSLEPISPATPSHSATTCVGARTEGSGILLVTPMVQSQSDFDGGVCGSWFPQPQLAAVDGEGGRPRHPGRLFVMLRLPHPALAHPLHPCSDFVGSCDSRHQLRPQRREGEPRHGGRHLARTPDHHLCRSTRLIPNPFSSKTS